MKFWIFPRVPLKITKRHSVKVGRNVGTVITQTSCLKMTCEKNLVKLAQNTKIQKFGLCCDRLTKWNPTLCFFFYGGMRSDEVVPDFYSRPASFMQMARQTTRQGTAHSASATCLPQFHLNVQSLEL